MRAEAKMFAGEDTSQASKRKRIHALLGALIDVRAALSHPGEMFAGGKSAFGSRVLRERDPWWYEYRFDDLEHALEELRQKNKRVYIATWQVYCERRRGDWKAPDHQQHMADIGVSALINSQWLSGHLKVPAELLFERSRPSTHEAKKAQNVEIRALRDEGKSCGEIADMIGVSRRRIEQIVAA